MRSGGGRRTGDWVQREAVAHPLFWERHGDRVVLARHVRSRAAAARVAGLRQPRRSVGVRALARRAAADRGGVPARRLRLARRRARPSLGRRRPDATHGVFDFTSWDPEAGRAAILGRERLGRRGSGRQRLGMDEHGVRPVPRLSGDGVISRVLRRFLRRRAHGHERSFAGDGARAAAADLPQLVPRALSVRICNLPLRDAERRRSGARSTRIRRATSSIT